MTSSGSGAYRVVGPLSSSNLSPLAPPFKVDKSLSKMNSTNPSMNFVDGPVYGSCFDPAPGQFWSSSTSTTSGSKCVATESVVMNTNSSSSPNVYRYGDSQSNNSQAGLYYGNGSGNGNGVTPFDPFSYEPFPNITPTNAIEVSKPYFVPYVPPSSQKDGYLSPGIGSEPGYDLLSYSGSTHMSGSLTAQVDQQALPNDGGYKSKWGSFWSAFGESEHGNWTDYVQGGASKDLNGSVFSSNKSPTYVDGTNKGHPFLDINVRPVLGGSGMSHPFEDVSDQSHLNKGSSSTQDLGLHGQASTTKDNSFDIFGGACNLSGLGIDQKICNPLFERSETITSVSLPSLSKEAPQLHEPVFESISNFCTSQKATTVSSPDGHFREPGYFMFGCASSNPTFPKSMASTPSAVKWNSMGVDSVDKSNTTRGFDFTYQMEGQIPVSLKRHSSIRIRKPISSSTAYSVQTGKLDDSRLEMKISPRQSNLDGSNMEGSNVEAVYSVEKHSDGHNNAEDSPCWKGASSHRFSPFGHSENGDSDVLVKKIDTSFKTLSSQDLPNSTILSDTFCSNDISSQKSNEANPPITDPTLNNNQDRGSVNSKLCQFDLNTGGGIQFTDDCNGSMVEGNMMNKSKEERGNNTPLVEENLSGFPSNEEDSPSNFLSGNSKSGIDVNLVLRTMMNLSESFRSYCFSNRAEVSDKQAQAIKQILCNLNASMLLISGQTIGSPVLSLPDKLVLKDFPAVQMVNDTEVLATSLKLGGTTEEFSDYLSSKDDENSFEDANMTKAVKKLLSEDFQEENVDKQKLLYKNLWLEAEASLCVMTAKARFLRIKTEMKRTHDRVKDKDNSKSSNLHSQSLGEVPNPTTTNHIKVFHDLKSQVGNVDSSESEKSTSTINKTSFSSLYASKPCEGKMENSCSTSNANDVDTCVMDRYQILKNRVGCPDSLNNESNLPSTEQKCPSSEFDVGDTSLPLGTNIKQNDLEMPVFGGYQILKGRGESPVCSNSEAQQLPGDENYLPDNDFPNNKALQDSGMSNSLGMSVDSEASVMARFRLLQSRINRSNFLVNDSGPVQASAVLAEDGSDDIVEGYTKSNVDKISFGPYPQLREDENVDNFEIGINEQAFDPSILMNNKIFEGWYDNNDCSSSDWEHISGRDI